MDQLVSYLPSILSILFSGAAGFYSWLAQRNAAATSEIERLEKANGELEKRVSKLENEFVHLPDKDLVTEIRLAMVELKGEVATLSAKLVGVGNTVTLIDQTLRNHN